MNDLEIDGLRDTAYQFAWECHWYQSFKCPECEMEYGLQPHEKYCPDCGIEIRTKPSEWKHCPDCGNWKRVQDYGTHHVCCKCYKIRAIKKRTETRTRQKTGHFSPENLQKV